MPLGPTREKLLFGVARRRRLHRYTLWRIAVGILFTAGIAAIPWTGWLRFDLVGGRHLVGGKELGFAEAARAFAFPFLALNVVILLTTRFAGRYLCGFVCPVGNLARIAEWTRRRRTHRGLAVLGTLSLLGLCFTLALITLSFFVDLGVLTAGDGGAAAWLAALLTGVTVTLFVASRRPGLGFCRDWCPSGAYFALLGPESATGVELAHPEACTDCKACDIACPVDLSPREILSAREHSARGIYPQGLKSLALCLRCGDCVRVCEGANEKRSGPTALRMGFVSARDPKHEESMTG